MRRGICIAGALALTLTGLLTPSAAHAVGNGRGDGTPNTFDAWTLNPVDSQGNEIPYSGSAPVQYDESFDNSNYTVESGEDTVNGCTKPGPTAVYAGKTAWFRFNSAVAGTLDVLATTPSYDSVMVVRPATKVTWGTTQFSDMHGFTQQLCADNTIGAGDEGISGFKVDPNLTTFVLVGGKCPGDTSTCGDPGVPGGPSSIRVVFTPSDQDGDGVPDTNDQCPSTPAGTPVNAAGCPDQDRDGIADSEDDCPTVAGVPAAHPFNGCPAGPTPPTGRPRVTITSLSGDPNNTNSTHVLLNLDWRQGTSKVLVDNGVGDTPQGVDFSHGPVPWTLAPSSKSETRGVNVEFLGPGIDDTRTDFITLDTEAPTVPKSVVLPPSGGRWAVGVSVTDGKAGSGVRSFTVLDKKRHAISRPVKCRGKCVSFLTSLPTRRQPRFVDVVDQAGNQDMVRLKGASRGCRIAVFAVDSPTTYMCFHVGDSCRRPNGSKTWDFEERGLACRLGLVVRATGS